MRVSKPILGALLALLVMASTQASATGDAAAVRVQPDCDPAGLVTQSITGRVSACLRLGNIAPGRHTIVLSQGLTFPPSALAPPGRRPAEPAATLTLSPAAGRPGTVVTVTGHLQRAFDPRDAGAIVCWDGCSTGLAHSQPEMTWTSPRTFRARLRVPAAPWIEQSPFRVAPLASGAYAISVTCLRLVADCEEVTDGAATFALHVTHPIAWCRTQATCAHLQVTPARAQPGQVVRITGFAPLSPLTYDGPGSDAARVQRSGQRAGVHFSTQDGAHSVSFGRGAFTVVAPPRYAAVAPLGQVSDGVPQIAADPANPGTVAWCAGQAIAVSGPAGTTSIPTATAKTALRSMGFSFRFEPQPQCAAVAPLTTSTGAPSGLAAAFSVTEAAGAPPFYLAALVTHDNGQTWAPIPVPHGSGPAGFGGFRYAGSTLEAVFAASLQGYPRADPEFSATRAATEVSGADGQSWRQAPLGCPPAGPCVTFGPYQPGNCAMNGSMQTLLRPRDGGTGWATYDFPYPVQACGEAELVATSPSSELLLDSTSTYPVLRTSDGGVTWHDVALPRRGGDGDLTVLPDGSLVMADGLGYSGPWKLLARGRRAWCELPAPTRTERGRFQVAAPTVIGDRLWWLTGSLDSSNSTAALQQVPLSALRC